MKYVVAKGACFTHNGKNFLAGDEIPAEIFAPKSALDKFVERGAILKVGEEEKKSPPADENSPAAVLSGGEKSQGDADAGQEKKRKGKK